MRATIGGYLRALDSWKLLYETWLNLLFPKWEIPFREPYYAGSPKMQGVV